MSWNFVRFQEILNQKFQISILTNKKDLFLNKYYVYHGEFFFQLIDGPSMLLLNSFYFRSLHRNKDKKKICFDILIEPLFWKVGKGPSINDVGPFSQFYDPLPPLVIFYHLWLDNPLRRHRFWSPLTSLSQILPY